MNPPNCSTTYDKLVYFRDQADHTRQLLLNEPRGRPAMCMNLVLPPCNPKADAGFLIMESEEYVPMSGGNTIGTTTVLLETGMVKMAEPSTSLILDTAAGLLRVIADCKDGKCEAVSFDNVPAFVFALDHPVDVPGLGTILVDIAWGGMIYAVLDASKIGMRISNQNGPKLIELGERIKQTIQRSYAPVHPENPDIRGVSIIEFTGPLIEGPDGRKAAVNTVVVSPGRISLASSRCIFEWLLSQSRKGVAYIIEKNRKKKFHLSRMRSITEYEHPDCLPFDSVAIKQ